MKELTLKQAAEDCRGTLTPEQAEGMITGVQIDSRRVKPGDLFVAIKGEKSDGHDFIGMAASLGASAALVQRPVKAAIPTILVPDTIKAYGDLAAARRERMGVNVIGITGSVGKTTTKEMTACMLERTYRTARTEGNHNNNIGLPMTILDMPDDTETAVLELGMNHFGEMARLTSIAKPDIAVITNIGTMHIEHLGSREGILQAKLEIFRGVPENGVGVFNGDEPLLWNVRADGGHKKYYYGIENHACDVLATDIQELDDGMRFVVSGFGHRFELFVPVLGRHTVYNTLAAVTAALLLKVPPETIQTQISGFHNTGMRQKIYERDGFTIIEDCYNAGPESTEAALEILAGFRSRTNGRCIAVLGDMLELGNRSAAEHYRIGRIAATKADVLYTYGVNAERMVSGAITGGMKQKLIEHFDTHEDLAHMLKMRARPGDVILFGGILYGCNVFYRSGRDARFVFTDAAVWPLRYSHAPCAARGPVHPRGRPAVAQHQGRYADHGRHHVHCRDHPLHSRLRLEEHDGESRLYAPVCAGPRPLLWACRFCR